MGKHKEKSKKHKKHNKKKSKKTKRKSSSSDSDEWVEKDYQNQSSSSAEEKIKKTSRKNRRYTSSDISDTSSEEERIKKHSRKKRRDSTSSESSSSSEDYKEKLHKDQPEDTACENKTLNNPQRDEWMSLSTSFSSTSNLDKRQQREEQKRLDREREQYNPRECPRELNPFWKDGGDGLPRFKKPTLDDNHDQHNSSKNYKQTYTPRNKGWQKDSSSSSTSSSNWRKPKTNDNKQDEPDQISKNRHSKETTDESKEKTEDTSEQILSDKELNMLASKLVKAEIMGNKKLVEELQMKLDKARKLKENHKVEIEDEEVILTHTDSKGMSRPVKTTSDYSEPSGSKKKKKQKIETHEDGSRVRYFADDDKYSLKEMFEKEKYTSIEDQNRDFLQMAGKVRKNDDLDEVFEDSIRRKESSSKIDARNRDKAVQEHQKVSQSLDNCVRCIQSDLMQKHLMISIGETIYLSLPSIEPITEGHCLIIPVRHCPCATQLDENEWTELLDVRKALTKMFLSDNEDVIFFEVAMNLNKFPHMWIECVPVPKEQGDLAPIYFKKAIDESETEWSQNKKLVSLKGRNVRKAIPKGLPYFSVSFGMEEGFAHVIEDERLFPRNFAQEIIGGMMDLHHSKWRKPKRQSFDEQSKRVRAFSKLWSAFDCFTKR